MEKPADKLTRAEKWALFFKYVDDERERSKINQINQEEEGLEMVSRMLEQLAKDDAMRVALLSIEKAENDRINALLVAEDKGMEKGRRDLIRSMAKAGASFEFSESCGTSR